MSTTHVRHYDGNSREYNRPKISILKVLVPKWRKRKQTVNPNQHIMYKVVISATEINKAGEG